MHAQRAAAVLLCVLASAARGADLSVDEAVQRVESQLPYLERNERPPERLVELGRKLAFDPRLSADGTVSCVTCHQPALAWTDGLPRARGVRGQLGPRNTPSVLNLDYRRRFFWDGRADTVEQAVLGAIQNRLEMDRRLPELERALAAVPDYVADFAAVFPSSGVTAAGAAQAIGAYLRAVDLDRGESRFDRFRRTREGLTPLEQRGLVLFAGKARCVACHSGVNLTDGEFHNLGVASSDPGRGRGAFRTPTLRGVALTAPYMHDGSLATLEDVVDFYDRGGDRAHGRDPLMRPLGLSRDDKAALAAFLRALTPPLPSVTIPTLPPRAPARVEAAAAALAGRERPALSDDALEALSAAFEAVERAQAFAHASEVSERLPGLSFEAVLDSAAAGGLAPEKLDLFERSVAEEAVVARAARAFATGDLSACDALVGLQRATAGDSIRADTSCRERVHELRLARALAEGGSAFRARCEDAVASQPRMTPASAARVCAALERHLAAPAAACAELAPDFAMRFESGACEAGMRMFAGADGACGGLADGRRTPYLRRCAGFHAYARARRGGGARACAGSDVCRVLAGDGLAVAREREDALRDAFAPAARPARFAALTESAGAAARRARELAGDAAAPIEAGLAALAEPGVCRGDFSVERALSESAPRFASDAALRAPLDDYLACRAFTEKDAAACNLADLPAGGGAGFPSRYACARAAAMWRFDRARLAEPRDAYAACLGDNTGRAAGDESPFASALEPACKALAAHAADPSRPERTCEALAPALAGARDGLSCPERLALGFGTDASVCAKARSPRMKARCLDLAAFAAARKAGSAETCGSSRLCRLLLDPRPSSCAPFLDDLRSAYCASFAAASGPPRGR